jgi:hypothetical protein
LLDLSDLRASAAQVCYFIQIITTGFPLKNQNIKDLEKGKLKYKVVELCNFNVKLKKRIRNVHRTQHRKVYFFYKHL